MTNLEVELSQKDLKPISRNPSGGSSKLQRFLEDISIDSEFDESKTKILNIIGKDGNMRIPTSKILNLHDLLILSSELLRLQIAGIISIDHSKALSQSLKAYSEIYYKTVIEQKVEQLEQIAEETENGSYDG